MATPVVDNGQLEAAAGAELVVAEPELEEADDFSDLVDVSEDLSADEESLLATEDLPPPLSLRLSVR